MSYTVYECLQDPDTKAEIVSEYGNFADYDAATAAADNRLEELDADEPCFWPTTWVEDEHGNQFHVYSTYDSWGEMMDEVFTEDPGY